MEALPSMSTEACEKNGLSRLALGAGRKEPNDRSWGMESMLSCMDRLRCSSMFCRCRACWYALVVFGRVGKQRMDSNLVPT